MLEKLAIATRTLRRSPGFFAMSVISLGVGIGLSTATFAYVDSTLNQKLPFADAAQLRWANFQFGIRGRRAPTRDQIAVLSDVPSFEGVATMAINFRPKLRVNGLTPDIPGIVRFGPNFFEVLMARPQLGRLPNDEEIRSGAAALVSEQLWSHAFHNRPEIGDAHLTVDNANVPIVGVLQSEFRYLGNTDVWIPAASVDGVVAVEDDHGAYVRSVVRLRHGVPKATANAQLLVAAAQLQEKYTGAGALPNKLTLQSYGFTPFGISSQQLIIVGLAIGILLIAASNVAALTLARALTRRRDLALRVALGASRAAIAREIVAEVGVISIFGAVVGAAFGASLIGVLRHMITEDLISQGWGIRQPELRLSLFVYVALGLFVSIAISGGVPAWRASQLDPSSTLKDNAGTTTGRARSDFRVLVIGELAIAMVLVMLTSLLTMSTTKMATFDFGFDYRKLVEARITFGLRNGMKGDTATTADRLAYYASVLARARSTPGVAAATTFAPATIGAKQIISRPTFGMDQMLEPKGGYVDVGPDGFRTLGIAILEGRDFSEGDRLSGDAVILAERASRALFPRRNAVGSKIKIGGDGSKYPWMRVIGVVRDVQLGPLARQPDPEIFVSTLDVAKRGDLTVIVRPAGVDPQLATNLERSLTGALPANSSISVQQMAHSFNGQVARTAFYTRTFTFIGVCALALAIGGLFSVLSFTVGVRMREFAVRVALGASPRQVLVVVMKNAFEFAVGGTAIGALLSFWASEGVKGMFYGILITDPVALIIAECVLLAAAMAASIIPALRATKADPIEVLRAT